MRNYNLDKVVAYVITTSSSYVVVLNDDVSNSYIETYDDMDWYFFMENSDYVSVGLSFKVYLIKDNMYHLECRFKRILISDEWSSGYILSVGLREFVFYYEGINLRYLCDTDDNYIEVEKTYLNSNINFIEKL